MACQLTEGSEGAAHRDLSENLDECRFVKPKRGPTQLPLNPTSPQRGSHWQSHHILSLICIANRNNALADGDASYLEKCLWITEWNVNKEPNMIGLPQNAWFRIAYGASPPNYKPVNIPSHNTGHHAYLRDVEAWLQAYVWNNYNKTEAKGHDAPVVNLKEALDSASENWRAKLKAYGLRNGGTVWSWENRHAGRPTNMEDRMARFSFWKDSMAHTKPTWSSENATAVENSPYANKSNAGEFWYLPFSMAAVPKPRSPGLPDGSLTHIFSSKHWQ